MKSIYLAQFSIQNLNKKTINIYSNKVNKSYAMINCFCNERQTIGHDFIFNSTE